MVHVFMLVVIMGTGEFRQQLPNPMFFYSIDRCRILQKNCLSNMAIILIELM